MMDFEKNKLKELVLYILNKTGGIDIYHLFKILYFAEMKHLAKWGSGIVPDEFRALRYGPVPTRLYMAVKAMNIPGETSSIELTEVAEFAGEEAPNVLLAKREADTEFLSKSETEVLDAAIEENKTLTFGQLLRKSHDKAWEEAIHSKDGENGISPVAMAKVYGADDSILSYIEEQMQIDSLLK